MKNESKNPMITKTTTVDPIMTGVHFFSSFLNLGLPDGGRTPLTSVDVGITPP
ncbi:MAG: hypothetical protein AAB407_03400 [Patescibacteria group bacterium]